MKYAYLICGNGKFFPVVFNKQVALANAKHYGMDVYRMSYQGWKNGRVWDCPTFRLCSEKVYSA